MMKAKLLVTGMAMLAALPFASTAQASPVTLNYQDLGAGAGYFVEHGGMYKGLLDLSAEYKKGFRLQSGRINVAMTDDEDDPVEHIIVDSRQTAPGTKSNFETVTDFRYSEEVEVKDNLFCTFNCSTTTEIRGYSRELEVFDQPSITAIKQRAFQERETAQLFIGNFLDLSGTQEGLPQSERTDEFRTERSIDIEYYPTAESHFYGEPSFITKQRPEITRYYTRDIEYTGDFFFDEALTLLKINEFNDNEGLFEFMIASSTGDFLIEDIAFSLTGDYVDVSAVPLPAGAWLFGTALVGVGYVSRRRKAKAL